MKSPRGGSSPSSCRLCRGVRVGVVYLCIDLYINMGVGFYVDVV